MEVKNMEKSRIEEIAMAVAMVEYYQEIIDNAKEEIRNLTEEEIAEINKGKDLIIKRQNYTKTIINKTSNPLNIIIPLYMMIWFTFYYCTSAI